METADLYVRVSTDEQAKNGYSQRDQEERLRQYCEIKCICIRKVIYEDHSAKTFNRPQWKKLLALLHENRGQTNLILFTKWDRFSRNAGDAYQMINTLFRLGVDAQAIEQPLDLSIPENKMMLAFYLAAPEVENDRKALNVFNGMRRAKKEGRFMGRPPMGYVNKTSPEGKKYIAVREDEAPIMKWAFEQISKGIWTTEQIWKEVQRKGIKRGNKSNFWIAVKNPIYCGKLAISKYRDEEAHLVKGLHEPLISEELFYKVQDVLNDKKKLQRTKIYVNENMVLRGFLICPKCGRILLGGGGHTRRVGKEFYYYYYCPSPCDVRFNAKGINKNITNVISKNVTLIPAVKLYSEIISVVYKTKISLRIKKVKDLRIRIEEENKKLAVAGELLLSGELYGYEFREIKVEIENEINLLEVELAMTLTDKFNLKALLDKQESNLAYLNKLYENGTVVHRRKIISLLFPEKIIFDGTEFQEPILNDVIIYILSIEKYKQNKKEIIR